MSEECPRCGAMGGFGCYECTPEPKATISDDLVKQTFHSLEGLDAYVRALDDYNDALVAANEELKAKLAKAVEALRYTTDALEKRINTDKEFREPYGTALSAYGRARAALEELKAQE